MNDFLFALNTVLPMMMLMGVGFFCRKIGLLTDSLVKGVNQLVYWVFLPVNLCLRVMNTPYETELNGLAFAVIAGGLLVQFIFLFLIVPRLEKNGKKVGVMIQGMGRGNYAFFGIPLVAMLFPGQDTSLASLMVIATVPVYNIMSVLALCMYGAGEFRPGRLILNILKSPLISGSVLGYALWILRVQPPAFLKNTMTDLGKIATPLALFTLGGAIRFASARAHLKQLAIVVPWKLILCPVLFLALSVALGMRGVALACAFIAFGAPTAVNSYPMAQQMHGDGELAAEIVAVPSVLSIATTFAFVFGLKSMGLI